MTNQLTQWGSLFTRRNWVTIHASPTASIKHCRRAVANGMLSSRTACSSRASPRTSDVVTDPVCRALLTVRAYCVTDDWPPTRPWAAERLLRLRPGHIFSGAHVPQARTALMAEITARRVKSWG
jgi:hypothetical protein